MENTFFRPTFQIYFVEQILKYNNKKSETLRN